VRATISLDPIHGNPCARRPLIPSNSQPRRFSRSLARSRRQASRSLRSRVAAPIEPTLASNRHSAPRPTGANLPATSCLDAFWTPAGCACGKSRRCRRPKTCTNPAIQSETHPERVVAKWQRRAVVYGRRSFDGRPALAMARGLFPLRHDGARVPLPIRWRNLSRGAGVARAKRICRRGAARGGPGGSRSIGGAFGCSRSMSRDPKLFVRAGGAERHPAHGSQAR